MYKVLYVDDSEMNLDYFGDIFSQKFNVKLVQNPINALSVLADETFDAIVLDVHMPLCDGFDLFKKMRDRNLVKNCPVLFFSSDSTEKSTIKGLKIGCDDYLTRTMTGEELQLRIANRIKKYKSFTEDEMSVGNIKIDKKAMQVFLDGNRLSLTGTEFKILLGLSTNKGKLVPREELSKIVWGDTEVAVGTMNTHITNLRSKLDGFNHKIASIKGRGFILKELVV
ncbi:response regulator transcription factor [Halobacteriovorax sp. GB3]|uniref:response regulator transcription factor n=1 Tax=Halobacteriovorax sp. GB3 TaxID=2719615 RepID=UPI002362E7C0|nr:response regulator transcription factor [Halobacteriovorax sp. GB3]MDD0852479.1 response regulator transcription factor [Halobacteriovorax sp. GB3]